MDAKEIKIKIIQLEEALTALMEGINSPKIPYSIAYWIGRNLKRIREELEPMAEIKRKLLSDYRLKDEKGVPVDSGIPGSFKLDPVRSEEYWKEFEKLNKQEVQISIWPIKHTLLRDREGVPIEIKPSDLACLDFLLEGELPENPPVNPAAKVADKPK